MKEQYKNKIAAAIKNKTLFPTLNHAIRKRISFQIIKNNYILDLQMQNKVARNLKRKFVKTFIEGIDGENCIEEGSFEKIIWWCWLQGFEQAPKLVKSCFESLKKNMPDYDIRIITYANIKNYITLPEYIEEKHYKGIIGAAHYTDLIRLELLYHYGGIWIDSTVLCTDDKMRNVIENSSLFVYQDITLPDITASNWLISAKPRNKIIAMTRHILHEYWRNKKIADHYYLFHLVFKLVTNYYQDEWNAVHVYPNTAPHVLVNELNNRFESERFEEIKSLSSFHKLNYKKTYVDNGYSFYSILIVQRKF